MKYVVLEVRDLDNKGSEFKREVPVIFPDHIVHSHAAAAFALMLRKERPQGKVRQVHPVSAGFIPSTKIGSGCHGESTSLRLKSRGQQDDDLIRLFDYMHGLLD